MSLFRNTLDAIGHILWPARCAACDVLLSEPTACLCTECREAILPAGPQPAPADVDTAWSFFYYEGAVQSLISRWKYHEDYASRRAILDCMADELPELSKTLTEPISVVSVPPHPKRLRERGFDPVWTTASRLSTLLSEHFGTTIPFADECLIRSRHTIHQAGLSAQQRAQNLKGAFETKGDVPKRVLLVDDVMTTGATLTACASALRTAGTQYIASVTLARTREG